MLLNNLMDHISNSRKAIDLAISRVLDRAWLVLGPEVKNFEEEFAQYIGVNYCVTVANGTDALELALRAMNVQQGDQVATVANSGMYATSAILAIGAEPFFMDVDFEMQVASLKEVERAIQSGVKVIIVTHLYGQAIPEIAEIASLCRANGVALLEDCAQSHGALVSGKRVGSFGDAACFSFYPTKNLGALGDGGAVVTNNAILAEDTFHLRQYGWSSKYHVERFGARNSRLDEIQAAILSVFLPQLDSWNARRREIALEYLTRIKQPELGLPKASGDDYVAHLFVVKTARRSELKEHLKAFDIATDIHYPIPDHRQPVFGGRYSDIHLPNTEALSLQILTLPCYPEMSESDVDHVINAINSWKVDS